MTPPDLDVLQTELALVAAGRPLSAPDLAPLTGLAPGAVAAALAHLGREGRATEARGAWALVTPKARRRRAA